MDRNSRLNRHGYERVLSNLVPEPTSMAVKLLEQVASRCHRVTPILAAMLAFSILLLVSVWIVQNYTSITSNIALFWCGFAVAIPLVITGKLVYNVVKKSSVQATDPTAAKVCCVEVCIDNETVLTVRSWWSLDMSSADVERHGLRVAMGSAKKWISENSHHGGKLSKIQFSKSEATHICKKYLSNSCAENHAHQCAICLDHMENEGGVNMRVCGHVFHEECVSSWFAQSSKLMCPLCRTDHHTLVPSDEMKKYIAKEEPLVSVLTVTVESGNLPEAGNEL